MADAMEYNNTMTFDHFDTQITCEEVYVFEPGPEDFENFDEVEASINELNRVVIGDPEFELFEADGGLTAEAMNMLGEMDANGEFV